MSPARICIRGIRRTSPIRPQCQPRLYGVQPRAIAFTAFGPANGNGLILADAKLHQFVPDYGRHVYDSSVGERVHDLIAEASLYFQSLGIRQRCQVVLPVLNRLDRASDGCAGTWQSLPPCTGTKPPTEDEYGLYMKSYGIKTDQFANCEQSVHHDAMTVRGDLSAPTCSTCHGNHRAVPPGVARKQWPCKLPGSLERRAGNGTS